MTQPVPMVVLSDTWIGTPEAQGSTFIRHGTVVEIVPGMEAEYGGAGNLAALPADQTGEDADHGALEN
jgi:hypothetical protein